MSICKMQVLIFYPKTNNKEDLSYGNQKDYAL